MEPGHSAGRGGALAVSSALGAVRGSSVLRENEVFRDFSC